MKQMEMMEKQDMEAFGASSDEDIRQSADEATEAPVIVEESVPRLPVALRLLRRLELQGMQVDYGSMAKNRAGEEWYVGREGVSQGPVTFREILEYLLDGGGPVYVIHESEKDSEDVEWTELNHTPFWNQIWVARIWTAAFWSILAMIGFGLVAVFAPASIRSIVQLGYLGVVAVGAGYFLLKGLKKPQPPEAEAEVEAENEDG